MGSLLASHKAIIRAAVPVSRSCWVLPTIQPGSSGTVHVLVGRITGVLYTDSQDNTYASGDFAPTYFGSQYVSGNTDLTVTFHLPPGVKPR